MKYGWVFGEVFLRPWLFVEGSDDRQNAAYGTGYTLSSGKRRDDYSNHDGADILLNKYIYQPRDEFRKNGLADNPKMTVVSLCPVP
jgi:hypothetical protein